MLNMNVRFSLSRGVVQDAAAYLAVLEASYGYYITLLA